jgi:hypothetical protein
MSATAQAMADFLAALDGRSDQRYARPPQHEMLEVSGLVLTSQGGVDYYTASIDGKGTYRVKAGGTSLAVGDRVLGARIGTDPFGADYQFVEVIASTNPFAGILAVDANIPYPALTGFTTQLNGSGGAIIASLTVTWTQVEEKYGPSGYKVSWRLTGTSDWQDIYVPHRTGLTAGQVLLSAALLPGVQVDVKIATQANWVLRTSPDSPTATYTVQGDTQTPAVLSSIAVNTGTPGQLGVQMVYSSLDPTYFDHWELTIATSPTGAGAVTYPFSADTFVWAGGSVGVGYYLSARARAKNGTYSNRIPVTPGTYQGPYSYAVATPPPDTTPPPAFTSAPTLADASFIDDQYATHGVVTVTLPGGYSFPGDYLGTEVLFNSSEGRTDIRFIDGTTTSKSFEVGFSSLWTVSIRGVDTVGNRTTGWSPTATISVPVPGIPATPGSAPTVVQKALALQVSWVMPTRAVWVELSRANDSGFTTGVVVIGTFKGTSYLDLEDGLNGVPPYPSRYYRIRGLNNSGFGPYSAASAAAAVQKLDGRNLVADTITAVEIAAGTITGTELNANIVTTSIFRTAASGARWEIEGHTGGAAQDQIRAYNATGLVSILFNSGLAFYNGAASPTLISFLHTSGFTIYRDGVNARMSLTGATLTFYGDGNQADVVIGISSARGFIGVGGVSLSPFNLTMDTSGSYPMILKDSSDVNAEYRVISTVALTAGTPWLGIVSDRSAASPVSFFIARAAGFNMASTRDYWYFSGAALTVGGTGRSDLSLTHTQGAVPNGANTAYIKFGANMGIRAGDIMTERNNNSGVIFFGNAGSQYIFFDGNNFVINSGGDVYFQSRSLQAVAGISCSTITAGGNIYTATNYRAGVNAPVGASFSSWNGDIAASAGATSGENYHAYALSTNQIHYQEFFYRNQGTSGWPGTVYMLRYNVDNGGFYGGALMLGSTSGSSPLWALCNNTTMQVYWSGLNNRVEVATAMNVAGFLTKSGGGFLIEYEVEVPLPDYFPFLNEEPDCLVQARDSFGVGFARARADLRALVVQVTLPGEYLVLAIATRKDPQARANWAQLGGTLEPPRVRPGIEDGELVAA